MKHFLCSSSFFLSSSFLLLLCAPYALVDAVPDRGEIALEP